MTRLDSDMFDLIRMEEEADRCCKCGKDKEIGLCPECYPPLEASAEAMRSVSLPQERTGRVR